MGEAFLPRILYIWNIGLIYKKMNEISKGWVYADVLSFSFMYQLKILFFVKCLCEINKAAILSLLLVLIMPCKRQVRNSFSRWLNRYYLWKDPAAGKRSEERNLPVQSDKI